MKKFLSIRIQSIALMMMAIAVMPIAVMPIAAPAFAEQPLDVVETICHRGASLFAPENTIPAIEKAIEFGANYVEIDIRETSDGTLVIMHDSTADRTTDGTGNVSDMTLEQFKSLDAGSSFGPAFKGVHPPTLMEAFTVMHGRIGGYLDFKEGSPEKLVAAIEETGMVDSVVVYDSIDMLLKIRALNPRIRIMPGVDNVQELTLLLSSTRGIKVVETSINYDAKGIIEAAHKHGVKVFMDLLGLLDSKTGLKKAVKYGVDGVQTDHPDIIVKAVKKYNESRKEQ